MTSDWVVQDGMISVALLDEMKRQLQIGRKAIKSARKRARLRTRLWKGGFKAFKYVYINARATAIHGFDLASPTLGNTANKTHSSAHSATVSDVDIRLLMLHTLLSMAIVTCQEIETLLRQGYTKGANARVRNLYEALVIATLIQRDKSGKIATRYHDSATIFGARLAASLTEWHEAPRWSPVHDLQELQTLRENQLNVLRHWQWRESIFTEYEWARPMVGVHTDSRVRFIDLENAAGLQDRRPIYRILSDSVHISPVSVVRHMSMPADKGDPDHEFFPTVPDVRDGELLESIPRALVSSARLISDLTSVVAEAYYWLCGDRTPITRAEGVAFLVGMLDDLVRDTYDLIKQGTSDSDVPAPNAG
jgi:uncharacterized protein DUF5677